MKNKIFIIILLLITLSSCGFSPVYMGSPKQIVISKSEIIGDKDLAFNLEQKLNFRKDEKDVNAYIFKAQIYDTVESSLVDNRGIATEEIIKLTVSYQFQDNIKMLSQKTSVLQLPIIYQIILSSKTTKKEYY